jgi:hypothetical protein
MCDVRRRLNEHRLNLYADRGREIVFVCECAEPDCGAGVMLTVGEYNELRPGPILAEGHTPAGQHVRSSHPA